METIDKTDDKNKITCIQKTVYVATAKIPKGKVATYAGIARAIGKSRAARAVGNALHINPFAPKIPCHRVVKSNGEVGGFADGPRAKIKMLRKEGVRIRNGKVVDFAKKKYIFKNFERGV